MDSDFYYSKAVKLYVSKKPLKIDSRTLKAANNLNIKLNWDDAGNINYIGFEEAKRLLEGLESQMLTPVQYWKLYETASKEGAKGMLKSLTSDKFCEWLDRVHISETTFIDSPKFLSGKYTGKKIQAKISKARPGWFNPENNIDAKLGIPKQVSLFREKHETSWKYWPPGFSSPDLKYLAPIRGFVTSVGKPSFDQGIPANSKQPVLLIRECRKNPLEPQIDKKIIDRANKFIDKYNKITKKLNSKRLYDNFPSIKPKLFEFTDKHLQTFAKSNENSSKKILEMLYNAKGLVKIIEKTSMEGGMNGSKILTHKMFVKFVSSSISRLDMALKNKDDIVFVMGHKNPDADTAISSLFEAFRNDTKQDRIVYIPIIQSNNIPDEIKLLVGKKLASRIILHNSDLYKKAKKSGLARWISVDQNKEPEVQKYFISIIDHHILSDTAKKQDLPLTHEMIGSCSALIFLKILGMGMSVDKTLAKMLYGATLLDTENRSKHKMTIKDTLVMDYLKERSETKSGSGFYSELMEQMLKTEDVDYLFKRDYKEDWGFGFAVAKVKRWFDSEGIELKPKLLDELISLSYKNTEDKNLPLTILRVTDYEEDNQIVNRERIYLCFNQSSSNEFKIKTYELLQKIIRFEFGKIAKIVKKENYIESWGTGLQLSRKKTAPIIEPLTGVFNEYFYSKNIKKWVKREFLNNSHDVKKASKKLGLQVSEDKEKRVNYITFQEVKVLSKEMGFSLLSLSEYWNTLNNAEEKKDRQMVECLTGSNFVEFLDTLVINYNVVNDHPSIDKLNNKNSLVKGGYKLKVPKDSPGLIHPKDIDKKTGFPNKVLSPNQYGKPDLWRYWGPDATACIVTRSYIFLLQQPCLDEKVHLDDSLPNLGARPCYNKSPVPEVDILLKNSVLKLKMTVDGDTQTLSWKN